MRVDENAFDSPLAVYKNRSVTPSWHLMNKVLGEKQRVACIAILLDLAMGDGVLVGVEEKRAGLHSPALFG